MRYTPRNRVCPLDAAVGYGRVAGVDAVPLAVGLSAHRRSSQRSASAPSPAEPLPARHRATAQPFSKIPYLVSAALTSPVASAGSPLSTLFVIFRCAA
jgi:hypothetical protein